MFWAMKASRNPPRGKCFWVITVSRNPRWGKCFEQWKFHETPKGEMFWAMTVSRNPRRGKMFYPARTRTTTTPHTQYNEQWKINIFCVGAYRSSRFYLPTAFFEFYFLRFFAWGVGEVAYREGKFLVPFKLLRREVLVPWGRGIFNTSDLWNARASTGKRARVRACMQDPWQSCK